jgi:hypothetical protein
MRRTLSIAAAMLLALLVFAGGALAGLRHDAARARKAAIGRCGSERSAGRDVVRQGIRTKHGQRRATRSELAAYRDTLERLCRPHTTVVAPVAASHNTTPAPVVSASSSSGGAGLPACASESGTNYSTGADNTNASSGATGRYQITPSTAANYGCDLSTAQGQDSCAQQVYARQGAGAWVGCGG